MYVGAVCKVLMCYRDIEVVSTEDCEPNVQRHLIDFHSLTDAVNVELEETVVQQHVRVPVVFCTKLITTHHRYTCVHRYKHTI